MIIDEPHLYVKKAGSLLCDIITLKYILKKAIYR